MTQGTLVNAEPFGRLGNRLFLAAHLKAFSLGFGCRFRNPAFAPYHREFPFHDRPTIGGMALARLRMLLPGTTTFQYWGSQNLDLDGLPVAGLSDQLASGRTVFVRAWLLRAFDSLARHRAAVVEEFRPRPEVEAIARARIKEARQAADWVVGVHVRWEDYRGTPNFLDWKAYRSRMRAFLRIYPERRPVFLVFSNERLDPEAIEGLPCRLMVGTAFEDIATLALCDQILAPPSTFSAWASFWGGVPLATLSQVRETLEPEDFEVCLG